MSDFSPSLFYVAVLGTDADPATNNPGFTNAAPLATLEYAHEHIPKDASNPPNYAGWTLILAGSAVLAVPVQTFRPPSPVVLRSLERILGQGGNPHIGNSATLVQGVASGPAAFSFDRVPVLDLAGDDDEIGLLAVQNLRGAQNGATSQLVSTLQLALAFTYDNANRLLSSTIAAGQSTARGTTYAYVGSAVASQADASGSLSSTTQFAYGAGNGLLASERWTPSGGSSETSTFGPDPFGRLSTRQDPDGLTTTYGYDNASRLASLQVDPTNTLPNNPPGPPNDLAAFSRVYGPTGLVKTESRYVNGYRSVDNSTWTYTYDAAGRLWKAQPGTGSLYTYTYDGAGNRIEAKWGTTSDVTTTYNPTTGLPQSAHDSVGVTTTTYTNDAAGELTGVSTGSQATTYTYDAFSRLTEASQTGTTSFDTHYTLDPLDRTTVSTLANGIPTYKGLVGRSEQIASALTSGTTTWYGWDRGTPMAQSSSTGTQYFVSDPHGDLVGLADAATHALVSGKTQAYDAWGNVRGTQATGAIFGYQGDPTDPNSGLVDMVTRNYDPNQGRFMTKDSVFGSTKDPASLDQWIYGEDNPATNVDPNGTCAGPDGDQSQCAPGTKTASNYPVMERDPTVYRAPPRPFSPSGAESPPDLSRRYVANILALLGLLGRAEAQASIADARRTNAAYARACSLNSRACATDVFLGTAMDIGSGRTNAGRFLAGLAIIVVTAGLGAEAFGAGALVDAEAIENQGEASNLLGTSYGRTGAVVENPGISIEGFQGSTQLGHAINQIINRGVSPQSLLSTVSDPTVVLEQAGNRYLYITSKAAVVITGDGQVVTAWTSNEFLPNIQQILADVGGG
jgi:RHS repeat-associated protein